MIRATRGLVPLLGLVLFSSLLSATADHPMKGQPAPSFDLQSLSGEQVRSEDFRGKFIVLHFGAGW